MLYVDIAVSAIVMLFCVLTIISDIRGKNTERLLFKTIASMLFFLMGFGAVLIKGGGALSALFAALLACLFGDIFLAYYDADRSSNKFFIYGVAAFSAAQVFFSVYTIMSFGAALPWSAICAVVLAAAAGVIMLLCKIRMERLFAICAVYALLLCFAFSCAVFAFAGFPSVSSALLAAGSLLFLLSDGVLMFKYFKKSSGILTAFNLAMYYAGVALIAISAAAV